MDFEHAKLLHERGQFQEATAIYDQLLNNNFHSAEVLFYYATSALQQGKHGLAANLFKAVLELRPKEQAALQNLGNCFRAENKQREAEEVYRMALSLGETADLWANIGGLNVNNGTPQEALASYQKARALDPDNPTIQFNMAFPYLEMGNFKDGWEAYEKGFTAGDRKSRTYVGVKPWDGSSGKRIIVWGEQGIGDEIRFASMLPDLIRISESVIFDCHPRLVDTFKRSFGIECYGTRKTQYLDWLKGSGATHSICISTLANFFRNDIRDFPGTPFLKADPVKFERSKPRIGISWTGGSQKTRKDTRTISLEEMLPILSQDCEFYSFQYTPEAARDVCAFEGKHGIRIHHYPNYVECKNYDSTVNFAATMDAMITVPTAIMHVTGGLGIPTWVMNPLKAPWDCYNVGGKMPWYRSAEVFTQTKDGEWSGVVQSIAEKLCSFQKSIGS